MLPQTKIDPNKLNLVLYPHKSLLTKSEPFAIAKDGFEDPQFVLSVADRMKVILQSMGNRAIGIAANQVGLNSRIFICLDDLNTNQEINPLSVKRKIRVFINPVLFDFSEEKKDAIEGCLSLPGIRGTVTRTVSVSMTYREITGEEKTITSSGLEARCWQHEVNHLDGINIIDHFTKADKQKNAIVLNRLKG